MTAKEEYNKLLGSGELFELFPDLSGVWDKDRRKFESDWEKNQEVFNIDVVIDLDDVDELDEYL